MPDRSLLPLLSRIVAAGLVLAVMMFMFQAGLGRQAGVSVMLLAGGYGLLSTLFWWWSPRLERLAIPAHFLLDALAAGVLLYLTGGLDSPFSILLGLIILAAGASGGTMLPIGISVLTCIVYLAAAFSASGTGPALAPEDALQALLQVSTLLLAGGVMAYIARRHQGLKQSTDAVQRQHRRLKGLHGRIMSSMNEGVIILDGHGDLYEMNAAARRLLARHDASDAVLAASLMQRLPDLREWMDEPAEAEFHREIQHAGRNLLLTAKALGDAGSAKSDPAWLLTLVDISDIRRLEGKLLEEEKMAELGRMSAMLAHEIRNPIQTMAQGLELMGMDESQRQTVQQILQEEMLRLNRLVNTMLDYSRPLSMSPAWTKMNELMHAALQQMDMQGENVELQCELDALWLDADHFRLVLDNLLSNALKNRKDEQPVQVRLHERDGRWRLRICNAGAISEAVREQLFHPFVSGASRGIGLGLATVRQVCERNGWSIEVESRDGQVCFEVSGPIEAEELRETSHG